MGYIGFVTHLQTILGITLPKTNMDTQNDGLEKVFPFNFDQFWVSMLVFGGVLTRYLED